MQIAFHAPLKAPDHPVPSGDRQMARLLVAALTAAGHRVDIASRLRTYVAEPDAAVLAGIAARAEAEVARLSQDWQVGARPDLWFTYHPYYKAPDLIGPPLARRFGIPYVTAEASLSERRGIGAWAATQALVADAVRQAAVNICFTARDRAGLAGLAPAARCDMLAPFIDTHAYAARGAAPDSTRLVALAMMRKGDKFDSFAMLAAALRRVAVPWTLAVIGDGPLRSEVMALFGAFGERVRWHGEVPPERVPELLARGGIHAWPGCGEAYGLAYLEAQAAGLPVVAQDTAGVPEVALNGQTGLLTPPGDIGAYAAALERLLNDGGERRRLAAAARLFVLAERSLDIASARLRAILA